jgi:hypothetical protein
VSRLILALLIVLSFLGSSVTPVAAQAVAAADTECPMAGKMPVHPVDQGKMDCCAHDCLTMAPAGLVPRFGLDAPAVAPIAAAKRLPSARELESLSLGTVDPPPRLHFT